MSKSIESENGRVGAARRLLDEHDLVAGTERQRLQQHAVDDTRRSRCWRRCRGRGQHGGRRVTGDRAACAGRSARPAPRVPHRHAPRVADSSRTLTTPPKSRRAVRRASSGARPCFSYSAARVSRWSCSLHRARARWSRVDRRRAVCGQRASRRPGMASASWPESFFGSYGSVRRARTRATAAAVRSQLAVSTASRFWPALRQPVELGLAVVVGHAPGGTDEALLFEPMERRIERALIDAEDFLGICCRRWEMPQPCWGAIASVLRISRSSVPWRRMPPSVEEPYGKSIVLQHLSIVKRSARLLLTFDKK